MSRGLVFAFFTLPILVLGMFAGCGSDDPTPTDSSPSKPVTPTPATSSASSAIAISFTEALASGDYAAAEEMEDSAMLAALPAAMLGQLWQDLITQYGAFQSVGEVTEVPQPPYMNIIVPVTFTNATVAIIVSVNAESQVAGLHFGNATPSGTVTPADYVNPDAFTESDVTVGSAPWALPGTLTLPEGNGPFPTAVLVAGSGPNDRDSTICQLNKPLLDLAWGLASQGIAVLRYDKRTFVYSTQMAQMADITVKEEVTDDVIAAISLLRSTPGIDPDRVFVVGHSLGGYLAPRIATQVPGQLRGIAMLQSASSTMSQLILMQNEYLIQLQENLTEDQKQQQLDIIRQQVALAESPDLTPSTAASQLPLGIPAPYWLDLRTYDPLATAANLDIPMFFSQAGRDYQIPPSELEPYQTALTGNTKVTFKEYPSLNHILFAGTGESTPNEYCIPGHVASEVVSDLAEWIKNH